MLGARPCLPCRMMHRAIPRFAGHHVVEGSTRRPGALIGARWRQSQLAGVERLREHVGFASAIPPPPLTKDGQVSVTGRKPFDGREITALAVPSCRICAPSTAQAVFMCTHPITESAQMREGSRQWRNVRALFPAGNRASKRAYTDRIVPYADDLTTLQVLKARCDVGVKRGAHL